MADIESPNFSPGPPGALKRPLFEAGNTLFAQDLRVEQAYRLQRLRRHNRYLHGWGVVCGLKVVPAGDPRRPLAVRVCPGYAIGPCGDEIEVMRAQIVDIADYLWSRPVALASSPPPAFIAIRYAEEHSRPVPVPSRRCGCEDTAYDKSRTRDSFDIDVLWTPPSVKDTEVDLCQPQIAPCPAAPVSPYVVLAAVKLPAAAVVATASDVIDLTVWS